MVSWKLPLLLIDSFSVVALLPEIVNVKKSMENIVNLQTSVSVIKLFLEHKVTIGTIGTCLTVSLAQAQDCSHISDAANKYSMSLCHQAACLQASGCIAQKLCGAEEQHF